MHSDLHSAGYFLNPQFQFGVEHSYNVLMETLECTRSVIERLEPSIDNQIRMVNQLLTFQGKHETFGTPQAQRAWSQMNPAEWWMIYGTCTPELQRLAIKVLSQTTSASNCERNWSTFSYIHTKARNRLKDKKLETLVFTYYNMRLKMRHQQRMSNDAINTSYNPISLDHIFEDVDPLSEWLQEKENPLLDGENAGMFPVDTSDDEINSGGDGLDGGNLSPNYDDDRGSGDQGEIRSFGWQWHGEEHGTSSAGGHFRHRSEFGGNMHAASSGSRDRSEPRARSKEKGKGVKIRTSEGSSSRRSTSSNPWYTDSSTSTHGFYPPGPGQSSHFQPPHGYYPLFPNYGMPYQPQMYPPPSMYQPPPPHMYPPPQIYPPSQVFENQGENVTFFGYIFGQRPQRSSHGEGEDEGASGGEGYDLPRYSTNW
ncbi:hypothetical protein HRI_000061100 [Hibiscus trionum]|uniref:HAT C-terminal dimerisation domain-containing protein n=1 Tax=Hibiscus trionum TaxID=183268 RepID=A0A9W7LGA2_HIBTR|nr:hypothetical protein HRI_000061100 [Hibiscus trionum]